MGRYGNTMELGLTVPALLFPAISLLYLSYNGRFLTLASLIRTLHREWRTSGDDSILKQIQNLRERLRLIRWMQICGAASFILAAISMTALFFGLELSGRISFGAALMMLIASVGLLLRENAISVRALELLLETLPDDLAQRPIGSTRHLAIDEE
ncbi:MAG: DUF2721 domain-containing protein [Myxococcota bacterium]